MSVNLYVCSKYQVEYKKADIQLSFDKLIEILEYFKKQMPQFYYTVFEEDCIIEIPKIDFQKLIEFEITTAKLKRFVFEDKSFITKRELRDLFSFIYRKHDKKNEFIRIEIF